MIGQVKISYKKILRKCRELSLAGGKYREYQGLCAKYQCARLTAVTKGLVPFEDKPFKAYLNKRMSKTTQTGYCPWFTEFHREKRFTLMSCRSSTMSRILAARCFLLP
ncbi:VirK [Klebsiella pneumoniae IS53]|nr:VirK [Klebsiella pneumoniae IS53]